MKKIDSRGGGTMNHITPENYRKTQKITESLGKS